MSQWLTLDNCRFEILTSGDAFRGLGQIFVNEMQVRSGRLPLHVTTQTFPDGMEFGELRLQAIEQSTGEARLRLNVAFRAPLTKLMRDHSFDPIHDSSDWDETGVGTTATLDLVLRPARDEFNGVAFDGFSYHYEYSGDTPLYFLLDKASWELGGDITGGTVYSQSSCSAPAVTFADDTKWTTEGVIFFGEDADRQNPVMTHNLPRWASHGSFDFQCNGNQTLIGVFERVDLIRSVLEREPHKAELKTLDKYIFDAAREYATVPKKILLNTAEKSAVDQQNLWTWIYDEIHDRARAEYGLREEPMMPRLAQNYWVNFTVESYAKDIIPAAAKIGVQQIFVDNLNESDLTAHQGNMCGGHEYRLAPALGGTEGVKKFVELCRSHNIEPFSWTNNAQSYRSPIYQDHAKREWFVKMEDARLSYGGAYSNGLSILDFKQDTPRQYWVDSLKQSRAESGLGGYLFDSFYNLGFMPVNYGSLTPSTQWRELLHAFKELQDADVHFLIESFGPFGQVQHGCPKSYNLENLFACYKVGLGDGYTTVPTGPTGEKQLDDASILYRVLAHKTNPPLPLFVDDRRIDELWTPAHHQALADYHANRESMHRRYLQGDGQSVLWHDATGTRATLWNFEARTVALPGVVCDATEGQSLPVGSVYQLQAGHTYLISHCELPVHVASE